MKCPKCGYDASAPKERYTVPEIMLELKVKRPHLERLLTQYADVLGPMERAGVTRVYQASIIGQLRSVIETEARCKAGDKP